MFLDKADNKLQLKFWVLSKLYRECLFLPTPSKSQLPTAKIPIEVIGRNAKRSTHSRFGACRALRFKYENSCVAY